MTPATPNLQLIRGGGGGYWDYDSSCQQEVLLASQAEPQLPFALLPLLEAAERGEIAWEESVVRYPLGRNVEIGELKIAIGGDQYRLYFAEPSESPRLLLALKFGQKYGPDWKRMQNDDIDEAGRRLKLWRSTHQQS